MQEDPKNKRLQVELGKGLSLGVDPILSPGDGLAEANNLSVKLGGNLTKRPDLTALPQVIPGSNAVTSFSNEVLYAAGSGGIFKVSDPCSPSPQAEQFAYSTDQVLTGSVDSPFKDTTDQFFSSGDHPDFYYTCCSDLLQVFRKSDGEVLSFTPDDFTDQKFHSATIYRNTLSVCSFQVENQLGNVNARVLDLDLTAGTLSTGPNFVPKSFSYNTAVDWEEAVGLEIPLGSSLNSLTGDRSRLSINSTQDVQGFGIAFRFNNHGQLAGAGAGGAKYCFINASLELETNEGYTSASAMTAAPFSDVPNDALVTEAKIFDFDGFRTLLCVPNYEDTTSISDLGAAFAYGHTVGVGGQGSLGSQTRNARIYRNRVIFYDLATDTAIKTEVGFYRDHYPFDQNETVPVTPEQSIPSHGTITGSGFALSEYYFPRSLKVGVTYTAYAVTEAYHRTRYYNESQDSFIDSRVGEVVAGWAWEDFVPVASRSSFSFARHNAHTPADPADPNRSFWADVGDAIVSLVGVDFASQIQEDSQNGALFLGLGVNLSIVQVTSNSADLYALVNTNGLVKIGEVGGFGGIAGALSLSFANGQFSLVAPSVISPATVTELYSTQPHAGHSNTLGGGAVGNFDSTFRLMGISPGTVVGRLVTQEANVPTSIFRSRSGAAVTYTGETLYLDSGVKPFTPPAPSTTINPSPVAPLREMGMAGCPARIVLSYKDSSGRTILGEPSPLTHLWFWQSDFADNANGASANNGISFQIPRSLDGYVEGMSASLYVAPDSNSSLKLLDTIPLVPGQHDYRFDLFGVLLHDIRTRIAAPLSEVDESIISSGQISGTVKQGNRTWGVVEPARTSLRFSSTSTSGAEVFTSRGVIDLSSYSSEVVGISTIDEKLIVFFRDSIVALIADDLGRTQVYDISTDDGCVAQGSIEAIPEGVIFQSTRGFMLLNRGLQLSFVGFNVDPLVANSFVSSSASLPKTNEVLFLCQRPNTTYYGPQPVTFEETLRTGTFVLVYNYEKRVWTSWDLGEIGSLSGGRSCLGAVRSDGVLLTLNGNRGLDPTNTTTLTTGWIKPSGISGFFGVPRLNITGRWLRELSEDSLITNETTLRVTLRYNYEYDGEEHTYEVSQTEFEESSRNPNHINLSIVPGRRKIAALQVQIEEIIPENTLPGRGFEVISVDLELQSDEQHNRDTGAVTI